MFLRKIIQFPASDRKCWKDIGSRTSRWGASLLLLLSTVGNLPAQEIGVWGWQSKGWSDLLRKEMNFDSETLQRSGENNVIPVEEFERYKLVILGQGSPRNLESEEHETVRRYLENGGFLLINSIAITGMAAENDKSDLSPAEGWLGVRKYTFKKIHCEIIEAENPALKHLGGNEYSWLTSERGLSELTTSQNLIGQDGTAIVLVNRVGKGGVVYIFPEVTELTKGQETQQDAEPLLKMIQVFLDSIINNSPAVDQVFGSQP